MVGGEVLENIVYHFIHIWKLILNDFKSIYREMGMLGYGILIPKENVQNCKL